MLIIIRHSRTQADTCVPRLCHLRLGMGSAPGVSALPVHAIVCALGTWVTHSVVTKECARSWVIGLVALRAVRARIGLRLTIRNRAPDECAGRQSANDSCAWTVVASAVPAVPMVASMPMPVLDLPHQRLAVNCDWRDRRGYGRCRCRREQTNRDGVLCYHSHACSFLCSKEQRQADNCVPWRRLMKGGHMVARPSNYSLRVLLLLG